MGLGNFTLVSGARFNPFTFDELLKPALMATEAHHLLEDAYGELGTLASIWEGMIDLSLDPELYAQLQAYAQALNAQVDSLARLGLSPTSRRDMLSMKLRYAREINPIEVAYKRREADIERQKKSADASGGLTVFTRDARTTRLKDYMDGIDDYGQANLNELFKEGATGAAAISSRYINTEEGRLFNNMYLNLKTTTGMSDLEVADFLSNRTDNNGNLLFPNLHNLKNQIMDKYNSSSFSSLDLLRMSNAILLGINTGIVYKVDNKPMENWMDKELFKHNLELKTKEEKAKKKAAADKAALVIAINPKSLYTKDELNDMSVTLNNVKKWTDAGYLRRNPDGTMILTKKGLDYANETFDTSSKYSGITTHWKDSAFRDFLTKVGAVEDKAGETVRLGNGKSGFRLEYKLKGYNRDKMREFMDVIENGYDATRSTEFVYNYGSNEELERAKDMIRTALGNSGALIYSFKGKDIGYTSDYKTIDKEDFTKNYTVLAHKGSRYGEVFTVENKEGKQFDIRVPEVNREQQKSAMNYYAAADYAKALIHALEKEVNIIMHKINNDPSKLTDRDREILIEYSAQQEAYANNLWEAHLALGRTTRGFETKNVLIP